jgi:uncharacterized membrane protein
MADAARPPAAPPAPVAGAATAQAPLFQVDSVGERIGIAAMLVLMLGALLPWGADVLGAWGPFALSALDLVPLALGFLAMLQVLSSASKASDVVMLGLASLASLAAVAFQAAHELATAQPYGHGLPVTLLGAALGLGAMEALRREAGLDYALMARRALELLLQPRIQLALLKLAIPFALAGLVVLAILEFLGIGVATKLGAVFALYFFNPAGKEVAIPVAVLSPDRTPFGIPALGLDPVLTWAFILFVDACTALFLVWNYDHVLRVPFVGRFFAWVERRGNAVVVRRKWIRRLAFFGLVLYATLPLEGTGAIGGSVVGRAIGLSPGGTFMAVVSGSVIRTTVTLLVVKGVLHLLGSG